MQNLSKTLLVVVPLLVVSLAGIGCEETSTDEEGGAAKSTEKEALGPVRLTIEYAFPGQYAYQSVTYDLKDGGDVLRWQDRDIPKRLVENLREAATKKLVPSDGPKSCRYAKAYPTLRVTFPDADPPLQFFSNARCADWVPWNVVQDGKLFVQLDGELGKALLPVLKATEPPRWNAFEELPEGRFEISKSYEMPEGVEAQTLPTQGIMESLTSNETYKEIFGDTQPSELRLLCSQRASRACDAFIVRAKVPYQEKFVVDLLADATLDTVMKVHWPADDKDLKALMGSKIFKSFAASVEDHPINLHYNPDQDCDMVAFGAEHYLPDTDPATLSCASWRVGVDYEEARLAPPIIFYYPALGVARLGNLSDHTDPEFYKRLKAREAIMEAVILERVRFFTTLDGEIEEIPK